MIAMSCARRFKLGAITVGVLVLSGCASVDFRQSVARTNLDATEFTDGKLVLLQDDEQRATLAKTADELLGQPLSQGAAVQLTLVNSPALQSMLAENWANAATAAQSGRIANPLFALSRVRVGAELEIERTLSIALLDLLTLPQRHALAMLRIEQSRLRLTADVIDQVTQVRQAWVKAVSVQQSLVFSRQVFDSAEASAELARRMQAAGNFNKLARARQQLFYADAATQLATAQHAAVAAREQLVRLLGLTQVQSQRMRLPDRLPDLPGEARGPAEVSGAANAGRLDVRMAQSAFDLSAKAQGLGALTSVTDIELGVRRDSRFDNDAGTNTPGRGFEISVRVPVFDWGGMQRSAMSAQTLAAANRLEATARAAASNLREGYSAYRTTYDIARHYRDEVLPLRKTIADENVLRYNGMLLGVFELLADAREQVRSVIAAIDAEQQFWLADAALRASIMGKPAMASVGATMAEAAGGGNAAH